MVGCEKFHLGSDKTEKNIVLVCKGKMSSLNPGYSYLYKDKDIEITYHFKLDTSNKPPTWEVQIDGGKYSLREQSPPQNSTSPLTEIRVFPERISLQDYFVWNDSNERKTMEINRISGQWNYRDEKRYESLPIS